MLVSFADFFETPSGLSLVPRPHTLDDLENIIDAFAVQVGFRFGATIGQCLGWLARQDQTELRKETVSRLTYSQREAMIVRASLPREPRDNDKFIFGGIEWVVRPRESHCFRQADREGKLLRVYVAR
jgi:hypothetical protein